MPAQPSFVFKFEVSLYVIYIERERERNALYPNTAPIQGLFSGR